MVVSGDGTTSNLYPCFTVSVFQVCAHRFSEIAPGSRWGRGSCTSLINSLDYDAFHNPCEYKSTNKGHEEFGYCQVGTSADLSMVRGKGERGLEGMENESRARNIWWQLSQMPPRNCLFATKKILEIATRNEKVISSPGDRWVGREGVWRGREE
jgi:hypothetical protein